MRRPSHGEKEVKGRDSLAHGKPPRFYFGIQDLSPLLDAARLRARSTSHPVAVRDGCTNIPLAAGWAQEDETILKSGVVCHRVCRFVCLDPPGPMRSW